MGSRFTAVMPAARHPGAADFAPYLAVLTLDGYIEAVLVDLLEGDAGASAPRAGPRREIERRLEQGARPQLAVPFHVATHGIMPPVSA
jgi:hypothetical protein